jgi:hypothetical protein
MPGSFVFDDSSFSFINLIFQMNENALLVAAAIIEITKC